MDELLNGDLIRIIADSFSSNKRTYTVMSDDPDRRSHSHSRWAFVNGGESGEEAGEDTPLIYTREEQRQRIATLALNGEQTFRLPC